MTTINIWCWINCELDPGHIALQIGEYVFGFTFAGEEYLGPEKGVMTKETETELAEWYVRHHLKKYMQYDGAARGASADPRSRLVYVIEVDIPANEYKALLAMYNEYHNDPPVYDRRRNNCVTTTIEELNSRNVLSLSPTFWPAKLLEQLRIKRDIETEDGLGRVISERVMKVNYDTNKGFHWVITDDV